MLYIYFVCFQKPISFYTLDDDDCLEETTKQKQKNNNVYPVLPSNKENGMAKRREKINLPLWMNEYYYDEMIIQVKFKVGR